MDQKFRDDLELLEAYLASCRASLANARTYVNSTPLSIVEIKQLHAAMSAAMKDMLRAFAMLDLQKAGFCVSVRAHDGKRKIVCQIDKVEL